MMNLTSYYVHTSTEGTKSVSDVCGGKAKAKVSSSFGEGKWIPKNARLIFCDMMHRTNV
jgi:hypothetical protein